VTPPQSPLIVALDTADAAQALAWRETCSPFAGAFKLGLEFFLAHGPDGVHSMWDAPVFLDLKLHDIPNTVAGAVRAVLPLQPRMLTVHAAGGEAMIQAAVQAAASAPARPLILAVTVLTSLDQAALHATGIDASPADQVLRLARMAVAAGADGVVCSPLEVTMLRQSLGPDITLVVPGIRPPGSAPTDQARTLGPREAIDAGADWIVVGRPITAAPDPAASAAAILASLQ
jgi:orotidine-5'-phosphate decarboxylase